MAYAAVVILAYLCSLGLGDASARLLAELIVRGEPKEVRVGLVHRVMFMAAVTTTVGVAVVGAAFEPFFVLFSSWSAPTLYGTGFLIGFWTGTQALRLVISGLFRGNRQMGFASLFDGIVSNSVFTVGLGGVLGVSAAMSLRDVFGLSLAASVASGGLALFVLFRTLLVIGSRPLPFPMSRLLKVTLPIMATTLLPIAAVHGTLWVVGALGHPEEVALYGAAFRLFQSLGLLLMVVNLVGGPLIAELHTIGEQARVRCLAQMFAAVATLPATAFAMLVFLFGREFMGLMFGNFYADATTVILVLSAGRALQIALGPNPMLLMMTGHERALAVVQSAGALALVATAILGYHAAGINGVAAGAASASVLEALVLAALVRRRLGFWPIAVPNVRSLSVFLLHRF